MNAEEYKKLLRQLTDSIIECKRIEVAKFSKKNATTEWAELKNAEFEFWLAQTDTMSAERQAAALRDKYLKETYDGGTES